MISDKFITPQNKAAFLQAIASTDSFNNAEMALLKTEFEKAQYVALPSPQAKASIYNRDALVDNPVQPQPKVPVTAMPRETFLHILTDLAFKVQQLPDSNQYKVQLLTAYQSYLPIVAAIQNVDFTGVAVSTMMGLVVESGAATQAEVDSFAKQPDPNWTAKVTACPRTTVLTGQPHANAYVEAGDVVAALAYVAPAGG